MTYPVEEIAKYNWRSPDESYGGYYIWRSPDTFLLAYDTVNSLWVIDSNANRVFTTLKSVFSSLSKEEETRMIQAFKNS